MPTREPASKCRCQTEAQHGTQPGLLHCRDRYLSTTRARYSSVALAGRPRSPESSRNSSTLLCRASMRHLRTSVICPEADVQRQGRDRINSRLISPIESRLLIEKWTGDEVPRKLCSERGANAFHRCQIPFSALPFGGRPDGLNTHARSTAGSKAHVLMIQAQGSRGSINGSRTIIMTIMPPEFLSRFRRSMLTATPSVDCETSPHRACVGCVQPCPESPNVTRPRPRLRPYDKPCVPGGALMDCGASTSMTHPPAGGRIRGA